MLCAIAHECPDRVPVGPFGLGHLDRSGKVAAELIAKTDPFISSGVGGNALMGTQVKSESVTDGSDTITTIFTPKGSLTSRYRRTEITGYTIEFPCKNADDVEKYMSIPYEPSEPNASSFLATRDQIGEEGLVLAGICVRVGPPLSPNESSCGSDVIAEPHVPSVSRLLLPETSVPPA